MKRTIGRYGKCIIRSSILSSMSSCVTLSIENGKMEIRYCSFMWVMLFFAQMWCPPTPPVDDSDVYIDHALCFLYEPTIMSEAQLPPVYIKKERKRTRVESISEGKRFCFGKSKLPVTMWLSISQRSPMLGQSHYKNSVLKLADLWKYPKIRLRSECPSASVQIWPIQSPFIFM